MISGICYLYHAADLSACFFSIFFCVRCVVVMFVCVFCVCAHCSRRSPATIPSVYTRNFTQQVQVCLVRGVHLRFLKKRSSQNETLRWHLAPRYYYFYSYYYYDGICWNRVHAGLCTPVKHARSQEMEVLVDACRLRSLEMTLLGTRMPLAITFSLPCLSETSPFSLKISYVTSQSGN